MSGGPQVLGGQSAAGKRAEEALPHGELQHLPHQKEDRGQPACQLLPAMKLETFEDYKKSRAARERRPCHSYTKIPVRAAGWQHFRQAVNLVELQSTLQSFHSTTSCMVL